MKTIIQSASFLIFISCLNQTFGQTRLLPIKRITIYSCETNAKYKFRNDSLFLESDWESRNGNTNVIMATKINDSDLIIIRNITLTLMNPLENELLLNNSINDGFNFKVYLYSDSLAKKIFVGNYYDERIDRLTSLFEKYLIKNKIDMDGYSIGYGTKEGNDRLIRSQKLCDQKIPDSYKKWLIDGWCELNEK